jgi:serine/threonine protein kinase
MKLENILISSSEYEEEYPLAKICDFGLCHLIDSKVGKAHMKVKCGTQGYIAPEQRDVIINLL